MCEQKIVFLITKMVIRNKSKFLSSLICNSHALILVVVRVILQFTITSVCLYCGLSSAVGMYSGFIIVATLLFLFIQMSVPLLCSRESYLNIVDFKYWLSQSKVPSRLLVSIIDAKIVESSINSLGFIVGSIFVLIPILKVNIILFVIAVHLFVRVVVYGKFFKNVLSAKTKSLIGYVFCIIVFSVSSYYFFEFLYSIISYIRNSVNIYGIGSTFVTKTNSDVHIFVVRVSQSIHYFFNGMSYWFSIFLLVYSVIIYLLVHIFKYILVSKRDLNYLDIPELSRNYHDCCNSVVFVCSNFRTMYESIWRRCKPDLNHTLLQVYVPLEFWIFIAINIPTLSWVNNYWALATVIFIEVFLLSIAVIRSFTGHYKNIFEFGFELKAIRMIKILCQQNLYKIFKVKCILLAKLALPITFIYSFILVMEFVLCKGKIGWWVLPIFLSPLVVLLASIWVLRPNYDSFCALLKVNNSLLLDFRKLDMKDVDGVDVFSQAVQIPLKLILFIVFLVMILGTSFGFIRNDIWKILFCVVCISMIFSLFLGCVGTFFEYIHIKKYLYRKLFSRFMLVFVVVVIILVPFGVGLINGIGIKQVIMPTKIGFMHLFTHNYVILIISILLGLISLGVGGLILPCYTMYNLGLIIPGIVLSYGWHPLITGIAPHALFEISSFVIGIIIGFEVHRLLLLYQLRCLFSVKKEVVIDGLLFITSSFLMLVAALIESGVSHV